MTSKFVFLFVNLICLNLISPGRASLESRVSGLMPALLLLIRYWRLIAAARVYGLLSRLVANILAALSSINVLRIATGYYTATASPLTPPCGSVRESCWLPLPDIPLSIRLSVTTFLVDLIFTGKSLAYVMLTAMVYLPSKCCLLLCGKSGAPNTTSYLNFSVHLWIYSSFNWTDESSR